MLQKITVEIRCLLAHDAPEWETLERLIAEIGVPDAEGRIIWKSACAFLTGEGEYSSSFVPAIWDRASTGLALRCDWLAQGTTPEARCYFRKRLLFTDGQMRAPPEIAVRDRYADEHFELQVGLSAD
jgi:hypothetical protein